MFPERFVLIVASDVIYCNVEYSKPEGDVDENDEGLMPRVI